MWPVDSLITVRNGTNQVIAEYPGGLPKITLDTNLEILFESSNRKEQLKYTDTRSGNNRFLDWSPSDVEVLQRLLHAVEKSHCNNTQGFIVQYMYQPLLRSLLSKLSIQV